MTTPAAHSIGTPPADFTLDESLIRRLLREQHPDLANLPLRAVDVGWDNAMYRLGDELAVRLPRRAVAAPLIINEQTWLPKLAGNLTLPVPVPLRIGMPGCDYPCRWSVVRWLLGVSADKEEPLASQAGVFGAFLRSLHVPAPDDAPINPYRAVPLCERVALFEAKRQRLTEEIRAIAAEIAEIWNAAVGAPVNVAPTWLHGDLHPRNVLVERGIITGVIDWGDMTAGDCAVDLASIWMLFAEPEARREALAAYGAISDATERRAAGWAALFGLALLDTGLVDHPGHAIIGRRTLSRLAEARRHGDI